MNRWPRKTVERVSEKVAMGPFGSAIKVSTFVPDGVPVISGQHLNEARVTDGDFNFVTSEHADKLSNANVTIGDVIFTHAGNIGQVSFIPPTAKYDRYVISQRQFYMRCDLSEVIPEFVTYFFRSPEGQHLLLANRSSTGVPSIARPVTYLRTIRIPVPPLDEQRRIASILGSLDDKIEHNRRTAQALERLARAIFKAWFVDFEPVKAKAEGATSFPSMPQDVFDALPTTFVDTEIGPVPEGWGIPKLSEVIELAYGKALRSDDRVPGPYPVFGSNGIVGYHKEPLVNGPGIIVGRKGNPGTVERASKSFFPIDTTFFVVPREDVALTWLFGALKDLNLARYASDSAVPGLSRKIAYEIRMRVPPHHMLLAYDDSVAPIWRLQEAVDEESRKIAVIRDFLLPKVLSGTIKVTPEEATVASFSTVS